LKTDSKQFVPGSLIFKKAKQFQIMSARAFNFLQGYDIQLDEIGTENGPKLDRNDQNQILPTANNISVYRQSGVDQIVQAMQDLPLNHFQDSLGNKFASTAFRSTVEGYYSSIKPSVATAISSLFLANASDPSVTRQGAIQQIYNTIVFNGLLVHFPAQPATTFNISPSTPPPGFSVVNTTTITTPPAPSPTAPNPNGDFTFDTFVESQTGLLPVFFEEYISSVQGTPLLHSGVTTGGNPGTVSGTVTVIL